jgi:hypothetical protein
LLTLLTLLTLLILLTLLTLLILLTLLTLLTLLIILTLPADPLHPERATSWTLEKTGKSQPSPIPEEVSHGRDVLDVRENGDSAEE